MKPILILFFTLSLGTAWSQEFIKDTLHLELEGKTYDYIIGETTASKIIEDFPELKLKIKQKKHAYFNGKYAITLGKVKKNICFSFYHKAESKEGISLSEATLSSISIRPRKELLINGLNCNIPDKKTLQTLSFKTDTFYQDYLNNKKYQGFTSDSENFTFTLKGKKKKVKEITFAESFATQIRNQDIYEAWRTVQDSIMKFQDILQAALDIPEMDEKWGNTEQLILKSTQLFPPEVKLSKFNKEVIQGNFQELILESKYPNLSIEKMTFKDELDDFGNVLYETCSVSYTFLPNQARADVFLKWTGLEWQVFKADVTDG